MRRMTSVGRELRLFIVMFGEGDAKGIDRKEIGREGRGLV